VRVEGRCVMLCHGGLAWRREEECGRGRFGIASTRRA
jgi:hypothetical protein